MRVSTGLLFGLVLAVAGCASTSKVMLGAARPAIAPEQVRVYFAPPPGRYEEIALLETSSGGLTYGEQNKTDAVISKLRVAAAELGANGVLFQGSEQGYGGIGVSISPTQKHARGVAVYVLDPPPPGAQPDE